MNQPRIFFPFDMRRSGIYKLAVFALLCISAFSVANAQQLPASDSAIKSQAAVLLNATTDPSGPGVAVLIARRDKVIYRAARGRANIELNVPLSPDNVFRIASVTKTFTAALVIKLA